MSVKRLIPTYLNITLKESYEKTSMNTQQLTFSRRKLDRTTPQCTVHNMSTSVELSAH